MALINQLDTSKTLDKDTQDKYILNLESVLSSLAPINISYKLSSELLEHGSFQINVVKKINGIIDTTVAPINKKFFLSQTYKHLITLNLHSFSGNKIILKHQSGDLNFSYLHLLLDHALSVARKSISLQRYKGLGEMNPSQLAETTMNPDTRSLLQVSQIPDDDYSIFDTLMGDDVEKRRDFIVSTANTLDYVDV